jgi:hypothetical protein
VKIERTDRSRNLKLEQGYRGDRKIGIHRQRWIEREIEIDSERERVLTSSHPK